MKLTPLDIKRHQFEKGFRGYDPDEVDGFLKQVADRFESLQEEIRLAHERTREVEAKLQHYERVEMALQEALESAKETGRRSAEDAERRAAVIVEEAELRAQQITHDAERERFGMRQDLIKLSARQAEVAARLRGFLLSELHIVSDFQGDDRHGLLQLDDAPELFLDAPTGTSDLADGSEAPGREAEDHRPMRTIGSVDASESGSAEREESVASDEAEWSDLVDTDGVEDDAEQGGAGETEPPGAQGNETFAPVTSEFADEVPDATPEPEHVVLAPPPSTETEPLAPDESGVVGESRPVEPSRVPPPMPSDPWTIPTPNVAGSEEERDRIRRILEDLD